MAYSINEKTVLRGGYGKYFLNPTGQSFNNGLQPGDARDRLERRQPHADLRAGQSVAERHPGRRRAARSGRGRSWDAIPASRTPTSSCRTCTSSRPASSASCRGASSLEASYAGSRSYDMQSAWNGFNEPSAEFQRQCDLDARRQPQRSATSCCRTRSSGSPGSRARRGSPARRSRGSSWRGRSRRSPAISRMNAAQRRHSMIYDSAQFVANKRWTKGITSTPPTPRCRAGTRRAPTTAARRSSTTCRSSVNEARTSRTASTASPPRACGRCRGCATARDLVGTLARRLVDRADVHLPVGTAVGHAGQRRPAPSIRRRSRCPEKNGQFIYGVQPCVGQRNANGGYDAARALDRPTAAPSRSS